jgi:hypothetical protein
MDAGTTERIETNVERTAAGLFAGAVAFATLAALRNQLPMPQVGGFAAVALVLAYLLCGRAMAAATSRKPAFHLSIFDVRELELIGSDELLLTEADRFTDELVLTEADQVPTVGPEPLLLEDALPAPAEDSRVVRLFDRRAMPTPGELKSRMDDHLIAPGTPAGPQSDAAKALADALAELRRSLR